MLDALLKHGTKFGMAASEFGMVVYGLNISERLKLMLRYVGLTDHGGKKHRLFGKARGPAMGEQGG